MRELVQAGLMRELAKKENWPGAGWPNERTGQVAEMFVCVFLHKGVNKVRSSAAPCAGAVARADSDEIFLEKD